MPTEQEPRKSRVDKIVDRGLEALDKFYDYKDLGNNIGYNDPETEFRMGVSYKLHSRGHIA